MAVLLYCFLLFVVVRGSQFCASNIACCVGIVHFETEERWVFLPTGSITATVLSASSPLFVSDELLKPADQFEYPSNISMSRTCVYSPAKFICCNMFCLIYSRWVIELIKFSKNQPRVVFKLLFPFALSPAEFPNILELGRVRVEIWWNAFQRCPGQQNALAWNIGIHVVIPCE